MKKCTKCKKEYARNNFHVSSSRKDGLNPWCKSCCVESGRLRRKKLLEREKVTLPCQAVCRRCKKEKTIDEFGVTKAEITGHSRLCKQCLKLYQFKARYGLSLEQAEHIISTQTECAICGTKERLALDHCHKTNTVRKMLCASCNTGLGGFKDNVNLLTKAIDYLS